MLRSHSLIKHLHSWHNYSGCELTATEMSGKKGNAIAKVMAGIFAEGYHNVMQKYVSNIIASFGTEQLLLLSNKKNGEKEE